MKKLVLALSILILMCGCSHPPSPVIIVTIAPAAPPSIDQGQTLQFTASLADDATNNFNRTVMWSATGPGCSGAACGTFTNVSTDSATYVAPPAVSTTLSVTVTATSVVQPTQSSSATFTVFPPPTIVTTSLPTGTPTYIYHTALGATGGVTPYNWSLVSGTLPTGMTMNPEGVIFGTPTTGSTSTITVKVTDSSPAPGGPMSVQQTFTLTILGVLSVPARPLPTGMVGFAYSATLPSTGGLPPLAWSIYSGNLPSGLVLQKTGVISGTPTVAGTYAFQVEVVDSSPIQQMYTSSNFSITINPSGPLTLLTTSLLNGTVDVPYQAQLVSAGGSPPLVWTITAGELPAGLTLNPETGAISGTPTTASGPSSFTVQVSDTSTPPEMSAQPLSITINPAVAACSSTGNNSILLGQYAFSLRGYNGTGFIAVVGSFTADGNGNVTAGEADTNGVLGAQYGNLIISASSYSVGPDNRGCATLATPFGTFYTRFVMGDLYDGSATAGRIMEFDTPGTSAYVAAGQILQQNETAFLVPLTGSYELQTAGWDSSTSGRYACAGIVSGTANKFSYLQQDCNDAGTVTNTINVSTSENTLVNTYTSADTNGRGTGIHSVGQGTSTFTFYWISQTELFIVNSDPSPTFSGVWQQENVPSGSSAFSQSSFRGNVAFYASGVGLSGTGGDVSIATETSDGVSAVTSQLYRDVAGTFQDSTPSCTYTVVAIGRMTLGGNNCGSSPPISYLDAFNSALVLGTDTAIELGAFEPQAAGLTNTSLAGSYYFGTSEVVSQDAQTEVGILTLTTNGIVTSTTDTASTTTQTAGVEGSDTLSVNADGSFSLGSSGAATVGVAISGTKFVRISTPSLTYPTLQIAQQ